MQRHNIMVLIFITCAVINHLFFMLWSVCYAFFFFFFIMIRPVKFLEKKLVTMHAMTTFSEQGACARTRRKTESGNTSLLLTSLVKWSAKLIGTLCSARLIISVSAIVIP